MKKLMTLSLVALATAAVAAGGAVSQTPPAKTWVCHKVDAKKWVAVRVAKSQVKGHMRHGDVTVPVAMQNRTAARTYCSSLPLVTATRGGTKLDATLAPAGGNTVGSGEVTVRASVGQQRVCWTLTVNLTAAQLAATGNVTAAHIHGPLPATGIYVGFTLSPATLASLNASLASTGTATVSGCETNVERAKVRQLVASPDMFYVNVHTTTFPAGMLQGTLSH